MRISDWSSDVCSSDLRTVVGDEKSGEGKVCVWRVFHKRSWHEFTIADGCKDYLRPPVAPVPRLERFWNIFTLSFNDIADETDIYPPPDPWLLRHPPQETNYARQGGSEEAREGNGSVSRSRSRGSRYV